MWTFPLWKHKGETTGGWKYEKSNIFLGKHKGGTARGGELWDFEQKFDEEIEKELKKTEKEIKNLKKTSVSSINKIAAEIASETIKQIIGTEVNKSNVTAIVDDLSKKKMEKFLWM